MTRMKSICRFLGLLILFGMASGLSAATYYIDPVNGNDTDNNGLSVQTAWRTFINVSSYYSQYYGSGHVPARAVLLQPGDTVYVLNGTITQITRPGDDNGYPNVSGRPAVLYLRFVRGTQQAPVVIRAYPGHRPLIDAQYGGEGLCLLQSSWVTFSGIDITRAMSQGEGGPIKINESDHVTIEHLTANHGDGDASMNLAGLNATACNDLIIRHCTFHDTYQRTAGPRFGLGTSLALFQGRNITVHDCLFYQTPNPATGYLGASGVMYKHSTPYADGTFNVYRNVFRNCRDFSVGSGTANTHIHHNIFIGGSRAFRSADFGGPTHQVNQVFEYNTVYHPQSDLDAAVSGSAIYYRPTDTWRNATFPNDPRQVVFRRNIVVQAGRYNAEDAVLTMDPYISDALFNLAMPEFASDDNVFFNTQGHALQFSVAASAGYGALGGYYDLSAWRSLAWRNPATGISQPLNLDTRSLNVNPQFQSIDLNLAHYDDASTAFRPAVGSSTNAMGAYAGLGGSLTITSPNGSEAWQRGESRPITWTSSGVTGSVVIELVQNGTAVGIIAENVAATAGTFTWNVGRLANGTVTTGTGCKIRIRASSGSASAHSYPF